MGQLKDIVPARVPVQVAGATVHVQGLSASAIGSLIVAFPDLRKLLTGVSVGAEEIIAVAGSAVAPIIAAGLGSEGDAEEEAAVARLPLSDQLRLLQAIFSISFPEGIGPFVEQLLGLVGRVGGADPSATEPGSS